jgi:hypothetical protein
MVRHYQYTVVRHARATPQTLFDIVADGSRWSEWAGPLISFSTWDSLGPNGDGGVGAVRAVGTARSPMREMTTVHEPGRRHGYTILANRPVQNYTAEVCFTATDSGTRIDWSGRYETRWRLVGAAYLLMVRYVIRVLANKLVIAAEARTATPSD